MNKSRQRLQGTVQKVIPPLTPDQLEKVEILLDHADELFREIRVENVFTRMDGGKFRLVPGAKIAVVLEAEPEATTGTPD